MKQARNTTLIATGLLFIAVAIAAPFLVGDNADTLKVSQAKSHDLHIAYANTHDDYHQGGGARGLSRESIEDAEKKALAKCNNEACKIRYTRTVPFSVLHNFVKKQ